MKLKLSKLMAKMNEAFVSGNPPEEKKEKTGNVDRIVWEILQDVIEEIKFSDLMISRSQQREVLAKLEQFANQVKPAKGMKHLDFKKDVQQAER